MENDLGRELSQEAMTTREMLRPRMGADFDRAYMDAQITMHSRVLGLLDTRLINEARSQEFQSFPREMRGEVKAHLEEARQLRNQLITP